MCSRPLQILVTSLFIASFGIVPRTAHAQVPPERIVVETAGGMAGAVALGGAGMVLGTAGMLVFSDSLSPAAPIATGLTGAAAGAALGVFGAGRSMGAYGKMDKTVLGLGAGAAVSGIAWGFVAATAKPGSDPGWLGQVFLVATALLPIVGAVAGFESTAMQ